MQIFSLPPKGALQSFYQFSRWLEIQNISRLAEATAGPFLFQLQGVKKELSR